MNRPCTNSQINIRHTQLALSCTGCTYTIHTKGRVRTGELTHTAERPASDSVGPRGCHAHTYEYAHQGDKKERPHLRKASPHSRSIVASLKLRVETHSESRSSTHQKVTLTPAPPASHCACAPVCAAAPLPLPVWRRTARPIAVYGALLCTRVFSSRSRGFSFSKLNVLIENR